MKFYLYMTIWQKKVKHIFQKRNKVDTINDNYVLLLFANIST